MGDPFPIPIPDSMADPNVNIHTHTPTTHHPAAGHGDGAEGSDRAKGAFVWLRNTQALLVFSSVFLLCSPPPCFYYYINNTDWSLSCILAPLPPNLRFCLPPQNSRTAWGAEGCVCVGGGQMREATLNIPWSKVLPGWGRLVPTAPGRSLQQHLCLLLNCCKLCVEGAAGLGCEGGKKRAGQREGWWGGKNTGIPGASPQPQPVCQSAWWGEERGEGKTGGRRSQKYTFQSKTQSLPCLQASPHRNATYVSSDPKVGNYSQAPELISAGSSATHRHHPPKKKTKSK